MDEEFNVVDVKVGRIGDVLVVDLGMDRVDGEEVINVQCMDVFVIVNSDSVM